MKPIIIEMKDMSDSTEVYDSRPHPFFAVFIYLVMGMLIVSLIWMYFCKMDIVVKGNGTFTQEEVTEILSSEVTGKIVECNLNEGGYVYKGDLLLSVEHSKEDEQLEVYESNLKEINERISIMNAYIKYLDSDEQAMEQLSDNSYYQELVNRAKLLQMNYEVAEISADSELLQYEQSVKSITNSVNYYQKQKENYVKALENVKTRKNTFAEDDIYFYSMIENYLSSYTAMEEKYYGVDVTEKNVALNNLQMEQIAALEQQINSIDGNIITLNGNLDSAKTQVALSKNGTKNLNKETAILTEKNTIAAEISTYESKKKEYESNVQNLKKKILKCDIKAEADGYVNVITQLEVGEYAQEGMNICQIIPENISMYQADIYISNQDIGKIKEGQEVKFEITTYPSSEYGYFTGVIETLSKDIKVDNNSGSAYYLAKVKCNNTTLTNKKGDAVSIMNGMACQAKVVTDEQSVLEYVLRKIDLLGE